MECNAAFAKGKTHAICQDYVLAEKVCSKDVEFPFILVTDGCSSSPNTDVGARLLAHCLFSSWKTRNGYASLTEALDYARAFCTQASLPMECLDATCLFAYGLQQYICIQVIGDGYVYIKYKDGREIVYMHEYPSGAPYYFNYEMDVSRKIEYVKQFTTLRKITKVDLKSGISDPPINFLEVIHSLMIPENELETVALLTDGCSSIENVSTLNAIQELVAFKNTKGEFVQRRLNKALTSFKNDHYDDISVAAITW
jgi:hypothetical protein